MKTSHSLPERLFNLLQHLSALLAEGIRTVLKLLATAISTGLVLLVRGYQFFISPYFPTSCRYHPTCSHYAVDAIRTHGAIKGICLAVWRILRCNPWSAGGEDPVPPGKPVHTCSHHHGTDRRDRKHSIHASVPFTTPTEL